MSDLKPFLSFFGAKWYHARRYPAPVHDVVVEPFAGSAGYSVRHGVREAVLVERDPTIAGVWRLLIDATPDAIRSLPDLPEGATVDDLDVPVAARHLIGFWLNKGVSRPRRSLSSWARDPRYSSQFWGPKIRDRIAAQVGAIKGWHVIEGDYTNAPDIEATWFVDPPYVNQGKHYRFNDIDYNHLGGWTRERRGQAVVCEQEGADWLPFHSAFPAKATTKTGGGDAWSSEAVWTS